MNNARRKEISDAISELEGLKEKIENIRDAEQEYYDNMPEGLQQGDKGTAADNAISELSSAVDAIDEIISNLDNAKE